MLISGIFMKKILGLSIFLFLVTIPFIVSIEPIFTLIYYFTSISLFVFCIIFLSSFNFNFFKKDFLYIISPYYISVISCMLLGFIPSYIFFNNTYYYYDVNAYGRLFNVVLFSLLAAFIYSVCLDSKIKYPVLNILKYYAFGCLILILSGYWHALSMYFNIVGFPFETRAHVHGSGKENYDILGRVTGFAAEPSYFVPFVLDFMIISLIINKKKIFGLAYFCLGLVVLILSFSPSGYVSMIVALIVATLFSIKINSKKVLNNFLIFLPIFCIFIYYFFSNFQNFGYVLSRLSNVTEDARFLTIYEIYNSYAQSNIFNIIFGYGSTNFKFASLNTNFSYFFTSNNLFFDVLIEMGLVGLFLFIFMFFKLFFNIYNSSISNYQRFIAYALFFDLLMTSMVRADYASARFFVIISIILLLSKIDLSKG